MTNTQNKIGNELNKLDSGEVCSTASVLVIDDTVENLRVLKNILVPPRFKLRLFSNPKNGLNSALRNPPELFILDVSMPIINGFELCRTIRDSQALAKVPVIFVSGRTDKSDVELALSIGAEDYLTKPFSVDELVARVEKLLEIGHLREDNQALSSSLKVMTSNRNKLKWAFDQFLQLSFDPIFQEYSSVLIRPFQQLLTDSDYTAAEARELDLIRRCEGFTQIVGAKSESLNASQQKATLLGMMACRAVLKNRRGAEIQSSYSLTTKQDEGIIRLEFLSHIDHDGELNTFFRKFWSALRASSLAHNAGRFDSKCTNASLEVIIGLKS